MKKPVRNLLIMLGVLLVLGVPAVLLLLNPPQAEETESSEIPSSVAVAITNLSPEDISSVKIENPTDSFTMVPVTGEDDSESVTFTLEGYDESLLKTDVITQTVESLIAMNSSKSLGETEDLEAYGLAGEQATTVTISTAGGEETLVLGNTGGETAGKYVLNGNEVYISSGVPDKAYTSRWSLFETQVYTLGSITSEDSDGETTVEADELTKMTIKNKQLSQPVEIVAEGENAAITSPIKASADDEKLSTIMTGLKSLLANQVMAADPTDEELESFGLTNPEAEISFTINGESHTLRISPEVENQRRYLLFDQRAVVYEVGNANVSDWANASLMDLRDDEILQPEISEVKGLTVLAQGDTVYSYNVERTVDQEDSTEDTPDYNLTVIDAGGSAIDSEAYENAFDKITDLSVLNMDEVSYGDAPAYKFEYEYFEGGSDVVELFPIDGQERYAARLNGEFNGVVIKSDVDKLTFPTK